MVFSIVINLFDMCYRKSSHIYYNYNYNYAHQRFAVNILTYAGGQGSTYLVSRSKMLLNLDNMLHNCGNV